MAKEKKYRVRPLDKQPISTAILFVEVTRGTIFEDPLNPRIGEKVSYISRYLGEPLEEISELSKHTIDQLFGAINLQMAAFSDKLKKKEVPKPKQSILVGYQEYVLVNNYKDMSAAWHEHVEQIDPMIEPANFLALNYIEKGMRYAQKDPVSKAVINLSSDRAKIIEKEFSAEDYLQLLDFFLYKWTMLSRISLVLHERRKAQMEKLQKRYSLILGKEQSETSHYSLE